MKNTEEKKQNEKRSSGKRNPMNYPQTFLFHALIVVVIIWLMFGVFLGITAAPNNDMSPNINSGDMLLYYRLDRKAKANDVMVIKKNDTVYIARTVAVGGDIVDITDDGALVVNGNSVYENKIFNKTVKYKDYLSYPYIVEKDKIFVLVDVRGSGEDSRYYGTVSKKEIKGTVITVVRKNNI